jgi:hypothetical protein
MRMRMSIDSHCWCSRLKIIASASLGAHYTLLCDLIRMYIRSERACTTLSSSSNNHTFIHNTTTHSLNLPEQISIPPPCASHSFSCSPASVSVSLLLLLTPLAESLVSKSQLQPEGRSTDAATADAIEARQAPISKPRLRCPSKFRKLFEPSSC